MSGKPEAVALITEISDAIFEETLSLEPMSLDLAYLYPAIVKGTTVEWNEPTTDPDDESDRYTNTLKLLRHLFPPEHAIWAYIEIIPAEPTVSGAERPFVQDGDLLRGSDIARPIDTCPHCGESTLIALCTVIVEYSITNDGEADQDWSRQDIDDDTSVPQSVRCESCGAEFGNLTLDERGYLVGLSLMATQEFGTD